MKRKEPGVAKSSAKAKQNTPTDRPAQAPAAGARTQFADLWRPDQQGHSALRGPERVLIEAGSITPQQLESAIALQKSKPHLSVLQALVEDNAIDELIALQATATFFDLPFQRLAHDDVDPNVFALIPMQYVRDKSVIPIRRGEKGIVLGVSDPADIFLVENVGRQIRKPLQLVVVPPMDIAAICEEMAVSPSEQVDDFIKDISEDSVEVVDEKEEEVADLEKIAGESPVIRYVNFMISSAVKDEVSDIHIEPCENKLRVRCRIDGILFEQNAPPLQMHAAIISRLKIMANLDIAERRLPQDGKIRATVHGRTVDLRVSTLPTTQGEKCVIRILDQRSISVGLENLGMRREVLEGFREQILQPHGVVVVTGPTGSGKSTTLYSGLAIMDSTVLNISTVEDPVEYEVGYANQIQVHDSIGMSFAAALRSLLRQDPDVIMVGEIRDEETGRIAIQAALTGHLVLSTLHTNDAPSSVTRMINIGVEPFLISAAVNGILAQRLIRRICPNCKEAIKNVPKKWSAALEACGLSADELYHGVGCDKCRDTGYKGRMGIHELLIIDETMRGIIAGNPDLTQLRKAARESGMTSLRQDGMIKAMDGHTTVEEVLRVAEA